MKRRSVPLIAVGIGVFIVPTHSIFREECRQQCEVIGMDYEVRGVPRDAYELRYPAECRCVTRGARKWWPLWK